MLLKRKPKAETPVEEVLAAQPATRAADQARAVLRDELGLYHLWYLELRLEEELARAGRTNGVFSLAAWQLRVLPGETLHPDLLQQAAALIAGNLRMYDIPARLDDRRFVAILLDADPTGAATVAFRMKGELQIRAPSAGRWQAGVATFGREGTDGNSLISATLRRLEDDARAA